MARLRKVLATSVGVLAAGTLALGISNVPKARQIIEKFSAFRGATALPTPGVDSDTNTQAPSVASVGQAPRISPEMPNPSAHENLVPADQRPLANSEPQVVEKDKAGPIFEEVVSTTPTPPSISPTAATAPSDPATMAAVRNAIRERRFENAAAMLMSDELVHTPDGLYLLASLYRKGDGVAQDDRKAFELMSQAAGADHLDAAFSLARMYLTGRGVESDRGQAQKWLAHAAEGGHVGATEALVTLMAQAAPLPQADTAKKPETSKIIASDIAQGQGKSPIIEAAERGEVRTLRRLLEAGELPDIRDAEGRTPLMLAAATGQVGAVRLLMQHGAQTSAADATGMTALMHAASAGHSAVVARLQVAPGGHGARDKNGHTAVDLAFLEGHCAIGTALFAGSVAPDAEIAVIESCGADHLSQLSEMGLAFSKDDGRGRGPVWYAARNGNAEAVKYLIDRGYSVDADNMSPLLVAINGAHESVAATLIEAGADIDAVTSSGNTPLLIASTRGLSNVSKALVAAGANIDHRNRDGYSALMLAAKYGRTDIAAMLIEHGADAGLRNAKRERASDIAEASGHGRIVALLN